MSARGMGPEPFESDADADAGEGGVVRAFHSCSEAVQLQVAAGLLREWGDQMGVDSVDAMREHVLWRWGGSSSSSSSAVLYVAVAGDAGFVGCVAVDVDCERDVCAPLLSHLYVEPAHRARGVGRRLVDFAVRRLRDGEGGEGDVWLFCERETVPFYGKLGWEVEARGDDAAVPAAAALLGMAALLGVVVMVLRRPDRPRRGGGDGDRRMAGMAGRDQEHQHDGCHQRGAEDGHE